MLCRVQPILDGFGAVRILRARGVTIPIIAVTAAATLEVRNQCLAAGMSRCASATQHNAPLLLNANCFLTLPFMFSCARVQVPDQAGGSGLADV